MTPCTSALFQTQPSANCERRQAARPRVLDDALRERERLGPELGLQDALVVAAAREPSGGGVPGAYLPVRTPRASGL